MKKEDLRIIFMGTPEFAVGTLKQLVENNYNVVAIVTQPDKPVGRHQDQLQQSAVKQYALQQGTPVLQPEKMKDPVFIQQLQAYKADLQVVVAFRMLPEIVWAMPKFGTFNVHAALLPNYRGAAPINWAIINGETQTGVTTFFLDHNIDTGRIIMQESYSIPDDADVEYVYDGLMALGAKIAIRTIDLVIAGNGHVTSISQEEIAKKGTVYHSAPKIFKDTCQINWNQTAKQVYDFIRGLSPYPGAWTFIKKGTNSPLVMKVFKSRKTLRPSNKPVGSFVTENGKLFVCCKDYQIELTFIQLSGKKRMKAQDFLNGFHNIEEFTCLSK